MTIREAMLILLILLPFGGSAIIGFFRSTAKNNEAWFAGGIALFSLLFTIMLYPAIRGNHIIRLNIPWLPEWGGDLILRMDGLSWLFCLLITGIGLLVVVYARYYMDPADSVPRFFSFFLAFMGSMTGVVLSGNLIFLVVFWELTSIFSFLLIGYWYHNASAREGARMALTITGFGGFALFIGILLIGYIVGSFDLDKILQSGDVIRSSSLYIPALICILLGGLTKSAQFPFHFWLPNAMAAPTPVSAYLHSATMVKAGLFLLVRLWPVLSGTESWFWMVGFSGLSTLLLGAYFSMFQQDLKGLLAYSTISHLGLITTLLSLGSPLACVAAIFHMANHATFKASLFMAAGIIDHETGTRDMRKLTGLYRSMPITATLALVASAAMAGVPLLNGFLSKEMFFAEAVETHMESWLDWISPYVATLASLFSVTYSIRFIHGVFWGPKSDELPKIPHEPPHFMRLPMELLVFICLAVGIFPNFTIGPILDNAVVSVLGPMTISYSLAVWHGFNTPLMMSLVALLGGGLLYVVGRRYFLSCDDGAPFFRHLKGPRIFERILVIISWKWARAVEALLSTRRLQIQLHWIFTVCFIFVGLLLWHDGLIVLGGLPLFPLDIPFLVIWLVGGLCALLVAWQAKFHRLASLMLLGGAGLMMCATFLWLSAPDLAITQLVVEVVTAVLLLLGLRWLPKRVYNSSPTSVHFGVRLRRARDFILAIIGGAGVAWLSFAMMTRPQGTTVSNFFLKNAYSGAGGRNVVNVLLVDFRGFDTMGEVVVLVGVSLTVFALLRRFRPAPESIEPPFQQRVQEAFDKAQPDRNVGDTILNYLAIPSVIMGWLFSVIIAFSFYLFVRGHDLPGGGFVGGVTLAIGFILQYLARDIRWVENHLRVLPLRWMGFGLLLSVVTGAGALFVGYPFLTSFFQYIHMPLIGKIPIASAFLFDFGVFSLVLGATILILIALAHQSIRSYRIGKKPTLKEKEN
ncbi:monovalent cation/H+ antiporter subunit A [Bartonella krasnovii]|uniref:Monovalent cation/H+ antiporter subunit A n=1 Tax=Bartonella krasnovii TaxID=2267275 RepID=A0A5B9D3B1_9HYPH|nr:monovalent cation/H+ antiporter subunit A [Bartonella krasnovii]QEE12972.1 monovalent cation/H+ antiporter subunit A [Bartonella krasnovii]UNF29092.1 monovalent cation/H+ antiporter subunit A [Bartonella krasnovii]UNF35449.1 monovalent cation/H+ antiporter subunit A [Bartonella krasnovii]UNF38763.1 monovalent cation/H+ antiporter subunit A [Bartonella krasnovii]UNF42154.1 monovalent cation/H+ antiporter subunit A [Bartonella krasnovii]